MKSAKGSWEAYRIEPIPSYTKLAARRLEISSLFPDHDQFQCAHLYFYSTEVFWFFCRRAGFEILSLEVKRNPEDDYDRIAFLRGTEPDSSFMNFPLVPY